MKTSDLRIGNYIKLMFNHEDYETLQVTLNDLVSVDKKQAVYEPIPLTEEWLLKFGFEKVREYFTIDNEFEIFVDNEKYYLYINSDRLYLHTLHQLQNLYFALTGEELTLIENHEIN